MRLEFVNAPQNDRRLTALVMGVFSGAELAFTGAAAAPVSEVLLRSLVQRARFEAARGDVLDVALPSDQGVDRLLLIGLGDAGGLSELALEEAGAQAYHALRASGVEAIEFRVDALRPDQAARLAFGARLASYSFDKYRTDWTGRKPASVRSARFVVVDTTAASHAFTDLSALATAIEFARDLVSEPPNVLSPRVFAERLESLTAIGLEVEVLDDAAMRALGMNALLAVGQGSVEESRLVTLQWKGGEADQPPIALVGKGVCFDSGGLSLKAKNGMEEMKWDMAGAAAVAGALHALAERKAPINVVGVLGLVENMPGGRAQRPSDIVRSMAGLTIEVVNTDAEGRLVLADALWYAQKIFHPRMIIDLATLTGAIQVSLGAECAGLFSNDDDLAKALVEASMEEGEPLWRMPLISSYEKHLRSAAADMKNLGEPWGEAISAALFLQRFIEGRPWAHIDMAATAWRKESSRFTVPDGATGFGVRLLDGFLSKYAGRGPDKG